MRKTGGWLIAILVSAAMITALRGQEKKRPAQADPRALGRPDALRLFDATGAAL